MEIDILIEKGLGNRRFNREWLEDIVTKVLTAEEVSFSAQISLLVTGQEKIHELNRKYLNEDRPTDVLSFPMLNPDEIGATAFVTPPDEKIHLGEVIISYPQAIVQAEEHGHSIRKEIAILVIHGILHLLGYDHDAPETEAKMKEREALILRLIYDTLSREGRDPSL